MVTRDLEIINRAGIHARPASAISKLAQRFKASIELKKDTMTINAKSIMGVITLGATYKSFVTCICSGPDENEAIDAMEQLFRNRFENEEINR